MATAALGAGVDFGAVAVVVACFAAGRGDCFSGAGFGVAVAFFTVEGGLGATDFGFGVGLGVVLAAAAFGATVFGAAALGAVVFRTAGFDAAGFGAAVFATGLDGAVLGAVFATVFLAGVAAVLGVAGLEDALVVFSGAGAAFRDDLEGDRVVLRGSATLAVGFAVVPAPLPVYFQPIAANCASSAA